MPAVALGAAALAWRSRARPSRVAPCFFSEDTLTFRDAPEVAVFLVRYVEPGDRFLVSPPADLILEYYLDAAGLDAGRLLTWTSAPRVCSPSSRRGRGEYTPREVIRQHLGPGSRYLEPVLVRRFPHARIYELQSART